MAPPQSTDLKLPFEQYEQLGKLADKCDNFVAGTVLPMPAQFHLDMLKTALKDVSAELKAIYVKHSGGYNPWAE